MTGTTSDGIASAPTKLQIECEISNVTGKPTVSARWEPPVTPNGQIISYHIELRGNATYRNFNGMKTDTVGPKIKKIETSQRADFENVPFNTNYTILVSAITRSKKTGAIANAFCTTPRAEPPPIGSVFWGNIRSENKNMIKLYMPMISERNGPICGYRIYLVRLPEGLNMNNGDLPNVKELEISSYHEVHASNNSKGGAYIAETMSNEIFQREIILGDGLTLKDNVNVAGFRNIQNEACRKMLNGFVKRRAPAGNPFSSLKVTTAKPLDDGKTKLNLYVLIRRLMYKSIPDIPDAVEDRKLNATAAKTRRRRRHNQTSPNSIPNDSADSGKSTTAPPLGKAEESVQIVNQNIGEFNAMVFDGPLDPQSNYTGFLEVIG